MNKSGLINPPIKSQHKGYELLLQGNYLQAASIYEQAISTEPDVKSNYWYLGLILLLQGQEVEAQTTWLMAMMEEEAEEVGYGNIELIEILKTEAERQEKLEEYSIAWKIRQSIKEISPDDVHNLLYIVQLSIEAKTYKDEDLQEYGLIQILKSEPQIEINLELLSLVLRSILDFAYLEPSTQDLLQASLPYYVDNHPNS